MKNLFFVLTCAVVLGACGDSDSTNGYGPDASTTADAAATPAEKDAAPDDEGGDAGADAGADAG